LAISSYMNEPLLNASTVGITGNTLTSLKGISASESGGQINRGWLVEANTITQTAASSLGINYTRGVSGKVQGNTVGVSFGGSIGIQLENTKNAYCGVNNLDGTDNSVGTAILATGNRSPYLQCNNSNLINTGIQVMDLNEGGVVETNSFNNYKVGLVYTGSTMMPPQLHRGNCWDNNKYSDVDASCESSVDAINSFYKVDFQPTSLGEMACYMPTKVDPLGWFKDEPTPDVTLTCSVLPPTIVFNTGKDEWDIKVATHAWYPEKYTESTTWRAEYRLFQKLLASPELVLQNAELSIFKTEKTGSNMDKLAFIESIKQDLFKLSTSEQTQLQSLLDQHDTKADKFNLAQNAYVSNPSIGKTEVNSSWAILQTKNAALESVLNTQQLVRVSQALNARGLNTQINSSFVCESNHKAVNEIYLRTIIEQTDLTSSEITQLQSIAGQCPYEGGDAVYEARSILGFIDEDYDDRKLCNVEGLKQKSLERGQEVTTLVEKQGLLYPNPVSDLLYINADFQVDYQITIFNAMGMIVLEAVNGQSPLIVSEFPSGLYRIAFQKEGKRTVYQNFSVVKL
jgi:Secretion system C-terminal sorting domain